MYSPEWSPGASRPHQAPPKATAISNPLPSCLLSLKRLESLIHFPGFPCWGATMWQYANQWDVSDSLPGWEWGLLVKHCFPSERAKWCCPFPFACCDVISSDILPHEMKIMVRESRHKEYSKEPEAQSMLEQWDDHDNCYPGSYIEKRNSLLIWAS